MLRGPRWAWRTSGASPSFDPNQWNSARHALVVPAMAKPVAHVPIHVVTQDDVETAEHRVVHRHGRGDAEGNGDAGCGSGPGREPCPRACRRPSRAPRLNNTTMVKSCIASNLLTTHRCAVNESDRCRGEKVTSLEVRCPHPCVIPYRRARCPASSANLGPGSTRWRWRWRCTSRSRSGPADRLTVRAEGEGRDLPADQTHLAARVAMDVAGHRRARHHRAIRRSRWRAASARRPPSPAAAAAAAGATRSARRRHRASTVTRRTRRRRCSAVSSPPRCSARRRSPSRLPLDPASGVRGAGARPAAPDRHRAQALPEMVPASRRHVQPRADGPADLGSRRPRPSRARGDRGPAAPAGAHAAVPRVAGAPRRAGRTPAPSPRAGRVRVRACSPSATGRPRRACATRATGSSPSRGSRAGRCSSTPTPTGLVVETLG